MDEKYFKHWKRRLLLALDYVHGYGRQECGQKRMAKFLDDLSMEFFHKGTGEYYNKIKGIFYTVNEPVDNIGNIIDDDELKEQKENAVYWLYRMLNKGW